MFRRLRALVHLGLGLAAASPAFAQAPAAAPSRPVPPAVRRAVETITQEHFRTGVGVLAHDSMRGRETPSPETEKAALWVASEFRRIGLRPAGDSGGYIQRFRLRRTRLDSTTALTATSGRGDTTRWVLRRDFVLAGGAAPNTTRTMPVVLVSGIPTDSARPFGDVNLTGAAVLHLIQVSQIRGPVLNQLVGRAVGQGAVAWIVVAAAPPPLWANFAGRPLPEGWSLVGREVQDGTPAVMLLRDSAAFGLFRALGEDPATLWTPAAQGVRALSGAQITFNPSWTTLEEVTSPNAVGMLEGSDRTLRNEAVVFVAHMDHVGVANPASPRRCGADGADSVCNGANDNASGTVGVVELAEAYASLRPRPRRSMVFVAVSAEERGLYGAYYYADHPVIPMDRTVAALDFDMIARNSPDTIVTVGKGLSTLTDVADRVAAEHPELHLVPANDPDPSGINFQSSDHLPFAQKGVPVLFFFSGVHPDLHGASDSIERADLEKATRVARLVFYIGLEVANAAGRPQWDPAARQRIVTAAGH